MSTLTDSQNIRLDSLTISSLIGTPYYGVGLYADEFSGTTGVNATKSTNALYDSLKKQYGPNNSSGGSAPTVSATFSGGDLAGYPPSQAFDNNLSTFWASVQQSVNVATNAFIGVDYGVGTAQAITQVSIAQRQDTGNGAITSANIQYSDDFSLWYTAYAATMSTAEPITQVFTFSSSGAHRYWRVLAEANPNNGVNSYSWAVAELKFLVASSAGNSYTLVSIPFASDVSAPASARLTLDIPASSDPGYVLNTDIIALASRDGGTTFTAGTLTKIATNIAGDAILETGDISLTGQPAGSSLVYKVNFANKLIYDKGVALTRIS